MINKIIEISSKIELNFEFGKIIIGISIATFILTIIFAVLTDKIKALKYVPGVILILIGALKFSSISTNLIDTSNLNSILLITTMVVVGAVSFCSALIYAIIRK